MQAPVQVTLSRDDVAWGIVAFCPENNVRLHEDFAFFTIALVQSCMPCMRELIYATNTFLSLFRGLTESWGTGPSSRKASQRKASHVSCFCCIWKTNVHYSEEPTLWLLSLKTPWSRVSLGILKWVYETSKISDAWLLSIAFLHSLSARALRARCHRTYIKDMGGGGWKTPQKAREEIVPWIVGAAIAMLSIKISYHWYPIFQKDTYCPIGMELQESEIRPESLPSTLSERTWFRCNIVGWRLHKASPVSREPKVTWRNGAMGLTTWSFRISDLCSSV